ncbi:MFS transporter [Glycomyces harbinensis]|uniref:Predicted arabinose efflux permease, MFS family n=1 Tax=Glycomyces harbinensis TaxID=58114 RepID=A0A1G6ZK96_9ACTN|nr:MFS transporter [Glycomyces harbinensis]SDE02823.1 Predicted arabinose efflux permease, MFS family [Glycomyces harbinensis]
MTAPAPAPPAPRVWETFRDSPAAAKVILAGVTVNRLSGFLQVFIVLYLTHQGFSAEQAVIAVGCYGGGAVVGALLGGTATERLGPRAATVISMSAAAVLTASLLYIADYLLLLVFVAAASACAQLFRPASSTLLSSLVPTERQTMIFAMYRLGLNLGATGAPLVGYGLYHLGGESFVYVFWGEAAIAAAYAALAFATLPAKSALPAVPEEPGTAADARGGYAAVLADRRFSLYLLATFLHSAVFVQYVTTLPLQVEDVGIALFWYTLAVSVNGAIVIAFELAITKVTQRLAARTVLAAGFALVGAGVAFYALPIGPAALIVGTLIWSLGEIVSGPAFFAHPAKAGPARLKAHYLGSFHFMFSLGIALGPLIGGWLYLHIGSLVWPAVATASLAAAVIAWTCVPRPERPGNA